jgi:hypothetical protein
LQAISRYSVEYDAPIAVTVQCAFFWRSWQKSSDFSEGRIASVFKVDDVPKQDTSNKEAASALQRHFFGLDFDPEDGNYIDLRKDGAYCCQSTWRCNAQAIIFITQNVI